MSGSREMSDIVKRLRGIRICENFALVEQAADEIESLRSLLADAQVAYVARGMELRDAEARLAEEVKNKKEFERDWLATCDELCNTRSRLASAQLELTHAANTCADQQCRAENAEAALVEAEKWVDALRAAAGKVTCKRCDDSGFEPWSDFGGAVIEPCSDCADLRSRLADIESQNRVRLKTIMARCADLLDVDQFNDLDAIATATVSAPAVCPECLGTGMGGTGGICRCKCGTNSASVTDVTTADKSSDG